MNVLPKPLLISLALLSALASCPAPAAEQNAKTKIPDVSGTWAFSHMNNKFRGFIELKQEGTRLTGNWHTTVSDKKEEDNPVYGEVSADTVWLTRYNIWNHADFKQNYTLNIANNGNQLYGYGEGFFLHHTDLNMGRVASPHNTEAPPKKSAAAKPAAQSSTMDQIASVLSAASGATTAPPVAAATPAPAQTAAPAVEPAEPPTAHWQDISKRVEQLVKQSYPKANFTANAYVIHFDYKVKEISGYYGDALAPQAGGILGDIALKPGAASGFEQERKDPSTSTIIYSNDVYSSKCRSHLVSTLTFPTRTSPEFKTKFAEIINGFKD